MAGKKNETPVKASEKKVKTGESFEKIATKPVVEKQLNKIKEEKVAQSSSNKILASLLAITATLFVVMAILFVVFLTKNDDPEDPPAPVKIVYSDTTKTRFNDAIYTLYDLEPGSTDLLDEAKYDLAKSYVLSLEKVQVPEAVTVKIAEFIESIPDFIDGFTDETEKQILKDFFASQSISLDSVMKLMLNFQMIEPLTEKTVEFFGTGITVEQLGSFFYNSTIDQLAILKDNASVFAYYYQESLEEDEKDELTYFKAAIIEYGPATLYNIVTKSDLKFNELCSSVAKAVKDVSHSYSDGTVKKFLTLIEDVYQGNVDSAKLIEETQKLAKEIAANKDANGNYFVLSRDAKVSILEVVSRTRTFFQSAELIANYYLADEDLVINFDAYDDLVEHIATFLNSSLEKTANKTVDAVYTLLNNFNKDIFYINSRDQIAEAKLAVLFANELSYLREFKTAATTGTDYDYSNLSIITSHLIDGIPDIFSNQLVESIASIAIDILKIKETPINIGSRSDDSEPSDEGSEDATAGIADLKEQIKMVIAVISKLNKKLQYIPVDGAKLPNYEQYTAVYPVDLDSQATENEPLMTIEDYNDLLTQLFASSNADLLLTDTLIAVITTPIVYATAYPLMGVAYLVTAISNPIFQLINPEKEVVFDDVLSQLMIKYEDIFNKIFEPITGRTIGEILDWDSANSGD